MLTEGSGWRTRDAGRQASRSGGEGCYYARGQVAAEVLQAPGRHGSMRGVPVLESRGSGRPEGQRRRAISVADRIHLSQSPVKFRHVQG